MKFAQRVYEAAGESLRAEAISAKMIKQQGGKTGGETLEERIANLFLTVGIPAHIKGYQYLREAVRMRPRFWNQAVILNNCQISTVRLIMQSP